MTTRRRLLVFGLPAGLLALGLGGWLWPRTAITRENAARIEEGMTLAQVEAILGGPPRCETTGAALHVDEQPMFALQHFAFQLNRNRKPMPPEWQSDHVVVAVRFDPDRCVAACNYIFLCRKELEPIATLRLWLRL